MSNLSIVALIGSFSETGNACVLPYWVMIGDVVGKVGAVGKVVVGDTFSYDWDLL